MRRYLCKETKWFPVLIIVLFVAGCSPCPPPIPPGLFGAGFSWLVVGLVVWGVILLWKNLNSTKTTKTDHLIDALNAINERLTALEEKMEQSEKDKK